MGDGFQVCASAKCTARASEHPDLQMLIAVELAERIGELVRGWAIDGIPYLRPIDDYDNNVIFLVN